MVEGLMMMKRPNSSRWRMMMLLKYIKNRLEEKFENHFDSNELYSFSDIHFFLSEVQTLSSLFCMLSSYVITSGNFTFVFRISVIHVFQPMLHQTFAIYSNFLPKPFKKHFKL
ncbi:hypothetical protein X975_13735, partial [Stegodyphus mimosarum]